MVLLMLPLCWGCSINATQAMRTRFLSHDLKPEKIDLHSGSKCSDTEPIILVNAQKNINKKYVFFKNLGHSHYFLQNEFIDMVIKHLESQLLEGKINVLIDEDLSINRLKNRLFLKEITREEFDNKEKIMINLIGLHGQDKASIDTWKIKVIQISLEEAYASYSSPEPEIVKIKIQIPSMNFAKIYTGVSHDADFYKVIAEAAHLAIVGFIQDPVFQKFVKCQ